jgi:Tol biopolymer transport system component
VNVDGSNQQSLTGPITFDGGPLRIVSLDWAPGGAFIAFEAINTESVRAIYRVEIADGTITQLTTADVQFIDDWRPVVSPDDSEILFARSGDGYELYRIPSDTPNGEVPISPRLNLSTSEGRWDWSPDGSEIVHATDQVGIGTYIATILRTTTQATYLADVVVVGRGGNVEDRQPSWRP